MNKKTLYGIIILFFSTPLYAFPVLLSTGTAMLLPALGMFLSSFGAITSKQKTVKIISLAIFILSFIYTVTLNEATIRNASIVRYDTQILSMDNKGIGITGVNVDLDLIPKSDFFKIVNTAESYHETENIIGYKSDKINNYLEKNPDKKVLITGEFAIIKKLLEKTPEEIKKRIFYISKKDIEEQAKEKSKEIKLDTEPFLKSLPSVWERTSKTVSENSKKYNMISIEDNFTFNRASIKDQFHINIGMALNYTDDFYKNIRSKIDYKKPTILINNTGQSYESIRHYEKIIASKIGISNALEALDSRNLIKLSFRRDDSITTPLYEKSREFISPVDFYSIHSSKKYKDSRVICFTEKCMDTFGSISIDARKDKIFEFKGRINIDISKIDFEKEIFISTENEINSIIASRIGYEITKKGFNFRGFLYDPGLYMGDARVDFKSGNIISTNQRFWAAQEISKIKNIFSDIKRFEIDYYWLVLFFVLIGFISTYENHTIRALSFLMSIVFIEKFNFTEEYLNNSTVSPMLCMIIFSIFFIISQKNKISSIIVVFSFWMYWKLGGFSLEVSTSIFAFSIGLFLHRFSPSIEKKSKIKKNEGSKSALSRELSSHKMKGHLVGSPDEVFKLMKNKKDYLLRSNMQSIDEIAMGGKNESYIINKKTEEKEINDYFYSKKEEKEKTFWLVPYIKFEKTGVIESVSDRKLSFLCGLGEPESVTLGKNAEVKNISRENPKKRIEKQILKSLKTAENKLGFPVHLEIGITKKGKVEILQARPQTEYSIENWQISQMEWVFADKQKGSENGENVIYKLTNGEVIMGENGTYRKKGKPPVNKASEINKILLIEMPLFLSEYRTDKNDLESLIKIISSRFNPIFSALSSGISDNSEMLDNEILKKFISGIFEFHKKNGVLEGYDIEGNIINFPENTPIPKNIGYRDAINMAVSAILTWIKIRAKDIKENIKEDTEKDIEKEEIKIIVKGDFNGKRVSISEFMSMKNEEKRNVIILAKSIPVSITEEAMKSKAVILTEGTRMSHFCLSAKSNQFPCALIK